MASLIQLEGSRSRLELSYAGVGQVAGKQVVAFSKADLSTGLTLDLALKAEPALTVADMTGLQLPGVAELGLSNLVVGTNILSGNVQFRGAITELTAVDFSSTRLPILSLSAQSLSPSRLLPSLTEILGRSEMRQGQIVYVPSERAMPVLSDYAPSQRQSVASVNEALKRTVGSTNLRPGLIGVFDVVAAQSPRIRSLLSATGFRVSNNSILQLSGVLPLPALSGVGSFDTRDFALSARLDGSARIGNDDAALSIRNPRIELAAIGGLESSGLRLSIEGAQVDMGIRGLPALGLGRGGVFVAAETAQGLTLEAFTETTSQINLRSGPLSFELRNASLSGRIQLSSSRVGFGAKIKSTTLFNSERFDTIAEVDVGSDHPPQLLFQLENQKEIDFKRLLPAGLSLKDLNDFLPRASINNLWFGTAGLGGDLTIKGNGTTIGGTAALITKSLSEVALVIKPNDLSLGDHKPLQRQPKQKPSEEAAGRDRADKLDATVPFAQGSDRFHGK
jgi:hypothetical protein